MPPQPSDRLQPFYLDSSGGKIFCLYYPPARETGKTVLYLPPMGEEMNRCRVMAASQARSLAVRGVGVLLLDYYGTGDSGGDFVDTHWQEWKANVASALDWVRERNGNLYALWGLRLGALLAAEVAMENPGCCEKLLLWQPITNGNAYLTQILRMRMAAQMDRSETVEKTDVLRERFAAGETIEIGGYLYSAVLATGLDQKQMLDCQVPADIETHWFEAVRNPEAEFSTATRKLHESWTQAGVNLVTHKFVGEAFWQLHERASAPELIKLTSETIT